MDFKYSSDKIDILEIIAVRKPLIVIPTYNEADNISNLYSKLKNLGIKTDILFIDDNSPDGTANIIRGIARKDQSVVLKVRPRKQGIGSAHLLGINYAFRKGYEILITIDADGTHKPKDILKFMKMRNSADVLVGSRYLSENSLSQWNFLRKSLTITAHLLTKLLLGMPYDATGAFRLYNLERIPRQLFGIIESRGYSFFFESLYILFLNRIGVAEISISLPKRTYGSSKMSLRDAWGSLVLLFQTFYFSKLYKDSYIYIPNTLPEKKLGEKGEEEWNRYWTAERRKRKFIYDTVATFYRKFIIRRNLNDYIKKNFQKGARMLHAGSGSGQVDSDLVKYVNITALDISREALNRYKWCYGDKCRVIHGSIFKIPGKNASYDGIYNLGVMEHFSKKEIHKILDEFHRVLKAKGKIVLFWPPRFGLSVIFLNSMHFIINTILKKNIRLHPEEITKVISKKQIADMLNESNFKLTGFHFGPSDLFTYTVIVGEKITSSR